MNIRAILGLALVSTVVVACGTSTADPAPAVTPPPDVTPDAGPDTPPVPAVPPPTPLDHGAVSTKYPAFTPATGQIATKGGAVLASPVIVTVTFTGDPQANDVEAFGDEVGAGAYWKAIASEYGAAAAISGAANHLRLTAPAPASISDSALATFIADSLSSPTTVWPKPATGDPVYILYIPTTTIVTFQGADACQTAGGYHGNVNVNGKQVAYAIVLRCGGPLSDTTITASHELDEAATDPYPSESRAYAGFREEDLAWQQFLQNQDEVGDACEFFNDSMLSPGDGPAALQKYAVQRQWSNASGLAGHDPCLPEFSGEVYFNTTPLDTEDIMVAVANSLTTTKGYLVKAGTTRQIPLGFYSESATDAWTIKAVNGTLAGGPLGDDITLALDVTTGQNGQKAYLSVTVKTASPSSSELITIVSKKGGVTRYMPFLIGN